MYRDHGSPHIIIIIIIIIISIIKTLFIEGNA